MSDDLMKFDLPEKRATSIKVIGVGGGGSNAVNHMYERGITDVDFVVCNTDVQDLRKSPVPIKIQIGDSITGGRGAGSNPEVGENAAKESSAEIQKILADDTQMVFITAGMGGGTGTGAAPVVAEIAKDLGILTVGIVTIPFEFEGKKRYDYAINGIEALANCVDSMLIVNNETLREKYGNLKITDAFAKADDVLTIAAKGIAEIITVNGVINVDFEDVRTVMQDSGVSIMSSGTASGENRAYDAITETLDSPLLNKADIRGAKDILLNFTSGANEILMDEVTIVTNYIRQKAEREVNIIWGYVKDEQLKDEMSVTLIATGFDIENLPDFQYARPVKVNDLGSGITTDKVKPNSFDTENKTMNTLDTNDAIQTKINWDEPPTGDSQQKVRLINQNSPFNGEVALEDDNSKGITETEYCYERVRKMDDISSFEKEPAFWRKRKQLDSLLSIETDLVEVEKMRNDKTTPSRFSIDETANGIYLSKNNKYLDHNAD